MRENESITRSEPSARNVAIRSRQLFVPRSIAARMGDARAFFRRAFLDFPARNTFTAQAPLTGNPSTDAKVARPTQRPRREHRITGPNASLERRCAVI